jgi:hypothetical protein
VNSHVNHPWLLIVVQTVDAPGVRVTVTWLYCPKPVPLTVRTVLGLALGWESDRLEWTVKEAVAAFPLSEESRTTTVFSPPAAFGTTKLHVNEPAADVVAVPAQVTDGT